jgi:hypothetical protein
VPSLVEPPEKRSSQRVAVSITAHCRIGSRYIRDPIGDLSVGGLYLRTREVARTGTPVRVAFAITRQSGTHFISLAGQVARLDHDDHGILRGLGVRFDQSELDDEDRSLLSDALTVSGSL